MFSACAIFKLFSFSIISKRINLSNGSLFYVTLRCWPFILFMCLRWESKNNNSSNQWQQQEMRAGIVLLPRLGFSSPLRLLRA